MFKIFPYLVIHYLTIFDALIPTTLIELLQKLQLVIYVSQFMLHWIPLDKKEKHYKNFNTLESKECSSCYQKNCNNF